MREIIEVIGKIIFRSVHSSRGSCPEKGNQRLTCTRFPFFFPAPSYDDETSIVCRTHTPVCVCVFDPSLYLPVPRPRVNLYPSSFCVPLEF